MSISITDFDHFSATRRMAGDGDPAALREVAGQFEALFIQTLLKNMRDASLGDGLLGDSEQHKMYESMLDQQLALEMSSGDGIGIAEMLVRQLGGKESTATTSESGSGLPFVQQRVNRPVTAPPPVETSADMAETAAPPARPSFDSPESFVRELWPHVKRIAGELNVDARAILAQAALETGWGKHMPQGKNGESSLNLFGIKADNRWTGDAVTKPTLEFDNGVARRETAKFRAYRSVAESIRDYFDFLTQNPRYADVVRTDGTPKAFGESLSKAGYATDPNYASKIDRVAKSEQMQSALADLEGAEPLIERAGNAAAP